MLLREEEVREDITWPTFWWWVKTAGTRCFVFGCVWSPLLQLWHSWPVSLFIPCPLPSVLSCPVRLHKFICCLVRDHSPGSCGALDAFMFRKCGNKLDLGSHQWPSSPEMQRELAPSKELRESLVIAVWVDSKAMRERERGRERECVCPLAGSGVHGHEAL